MDARNALAHRGRPYPSTQVWGRGWQRMLTGWLTQARWSVLGRRMGLTLRSRVNQRRNRIPGSSSAAVPLACHSQRPDRYPADNHGQRRSLFDLHRSLQPQVTVLPDLALGAASTNDLWGSGRHGGAEDAPQRPGSDRRRRSGVPDCRGESRVERQRAGRLPPLTAEGRWGCRVGAAAPSGRCGDQVAARAAVLRALRRTARASRERARTAAAARAASRPTGVPGLAGWAGTWAGWTRVDS
jgi:hypothetical protein